MEKKTRDDRRQVDLSQGENSAPSCHITEKEERNSVHDLR